MICQNYLHFSQAFASSRSLRSAEESPTERGSLYNVIHSQGLSGAPTLSLPLLSWSQKSAINLKCAYYAVWTQNLLAQKYDWNLTKDFGTKVSVSFYCIWPLPDKCFETLLFGDIKWIGPTFHQLLTYACYWVTCLKSVSLCGNLKYIIVNRLLGLVYIIRVSFSPTFVEQQVQFGGN